MIKFNRANQKHIAGKVKDIKTNKPLTGATIMVKGQDEATVTFFDGRFKLPAETGTVLEVSCKGYEPVELILQDEEELEILLTLE